jgi:hypothetical protein
MAVIELVLDGETFSTHSLALRQSCEKFADGPPSIPYQVSSSIPQHIFRLFLEAVNGREVEITGDNVNGLSQLAREFGFLRLLTKLSDFRLSVLEEAATEHQLANEKRLLNLLEEITVLKSEVGKIPASSPLGVRDLPVEISALGSWVFPRLDSVIITEYPALFSDFRGKVFSLLYRGSRDGFGGRDFHNKCDGRPNTLTVILDSNGNIFGGFTPTPWESPKGHRDKSDETGKSFLFTLNNPNGIPARKFPLKPAEKNKAINCFSWRGPGFGSGCDLFVANHCNRNAQSASSVGNSYVNSTEIDGEKLLTGTHCFTVADIEVFELTD